MPKAILKNGLIYPVEPLPSDWQDGAEVQIEKVPAHPDTGDKSRTDHWMDAVEALAAQGEDDDDRLFQDAITAIRQQAKELARQGKR